MAESPNPKPDVPSQSSRETVPLDTSHTLRFASELIPLAGITDKTGESWDIMTTFGAIGFDDTIASVVRRPAIHEEDNMRWGIVHGSGEDVTPDEITLLDPFGNRATTLESQGAKVSALYRSGNDELTVGPAFIGTHENVGFTMTIPTQRAQ